MGLRHGRCWQETRPWSAQGLRAGRAVPQGEAQASQNLQGVCTGWGQNTEALGVDGERQGGGRDGHPQILDSTWAGVWRGTLLPQWTAWTARSGEMREWGELRPAPRDRLQRPLAWLSPPSTGVAWTRTRAPRGCGRVRVICHAVQVAPSLKGGDATSIFRGADTLASSRLVWSSVLSRSQLARLWAERHTPGLDSLGGRQRRRYGPHGTDEPSS